MKRYTTSLLAGIIIVLLLIGVFNWLVNPFSIFSTAAIEGINLYRPETDRRGRLSKVYQVNRIKPDFIVLGSSRALEIPVDYAGNEGLTGFNLALASGSSYELLRMMQHAHAVQPLKRVVLGLDETFSESVQPTFIEQRMAVTSDGSVNDGIWLTIWKDMFAGLLSYDALRASLSTIKKQPGLEGDARYAVDKQRRITRAGGHRQMFRRMESAVMAAYTGTARSCDEMVPADVDHEKLKTRSFRKMLEMAYSNDIDFYIFFSPVHARLYEARCITGMWPAMENTRRAVVLLVKQLAKQAGKKPYPVWDFSGYNSITTEVVPAPGDTDSVMRWYWEGSHYSKDAAKLVLDRLFDSGPVPDDFGVLLTSGNLEHQLKKTYRQREVYNDMNPGDIEEVRSLLRQ